ncbi:DUF1592 domain-containing protein [Rhodopirellula bahusiensis]|uniref:Cytochrome c domain-containing protein n=1 Tax=Rhodopirellula bahusiensis TaxID=2014065 RepID=A0A2G1W779_9BACT|nr:DUF1592 domain-containing protein [Rhodopirellula bahusiensis]PHQ34861.1 hypothetical protein CEE69_13425 [Rhodopirellula bahusiensis]
MVLLRTSFALLFAVAFQTATGAEVPNTEMPQRHAELLENHCLDCHDSATKEANIDLETLSMNVSKDMATAELWSKVLGALNSGEMPPEDSEPLRDADKLAFLEDLSQKMVTARQILSDSGGDVVMRRLNRREYANTVESLLGVRPDVTTLPDDQATAGFDTAGASLFLSSDQIEQYHATATTNLRLMLLPRKRPATKTVRIEPEDYYTPHYTEAAEQMRDIGKRANAFLAQSEKPASEFGLLDEYQAKKQKVQEWLPLMEDYLARPETQTGITLIMTIKQGGYTKVKLPTQHPDADGLYHLKIRAAMYPDADERHHYLEFSSGFGTGRKLLGWRKVSAPLDDPQLIDFEFSHEPGAKQQVWIHQRSHQDRGDKNLATLHMRENGIGTPPGIWIDSVELSGPLPSAQTDAIQAARDSILFEQPSDMEESEYVREVIRRFATRAFRGSPPADEYLQRLGEHYQTARDQGQTLAEALISPLSIVMASPSFLYQVEQADSDQQRSLLPTELAVRLSYFLCSAPPDEELLALAESGELSDPATLASQTERLLQDQRSVAFLEGFVHQWLQMERLDMFQFNGADFPNFDNAVRENARQELFETFAYLLDNDLPLQKLLKADFVVINDLLAGYYEIEGVQGHEFRKVPVPANSIRGGLLGTAAVLAMGSDGQRSSPVERGAWVLRHLLHDPPPPAPPNVPQLSRLAGESLSARDLARAHQEQPQCANCHRKIDPIGFGLENFDAAGQWRNQEVIGLGKRRYGRWQDEVRFDIEPAGTLPNEQAFSNFFELRDAVAEHEDEFARGFTEALIAYGLGRPFGFTDAELAEQISSQAKQHNHSIREFIHALIQSRAFQTH